MAAGKSRRPPPEIPDISAGSWNNMRGPVHRALKWMSQHLYGSLPAPHQATHLVDGSDQLQTPDNPATLDPNLGALVGTGPSYAREDHRHPLDLKLTTKGDLLTRTTTAYARLPVGTDGDALLADSTQALGLRYGPPKGAKNAEYLAWVL